MLHTLANDFLHSLSCRDVSNENEDGEDVGDPTGLEGLTYTGDVLANKRSPENAE